MSSSHWYYSSYTCMVCTINSAGQARTRHDTSLGYLHLLAKEVDTNIHTETKKKKKERKRKNGHVIAQTKTCSQGLGLGWQHWDVLHIDQAIRLQILQAPTCQFRISDPSLWGFLYSSSCNETPVTPEMYFYQHTRTVIIHTNTLAYAVNTLLPKQEVKIK